MDNNRIIIGRSVDAHIVLTDHTVSKRHAALIIDSNGNLLFEDLGSTNGSFVNGKQVTGVTDLKMGDKIRLGSFNFNWEDYILSTDNNQKDEEMVSASTFATNSPTVRRGTSSTMKVIGALILVGIIAVGVYFYLDSEGNGSGNDDPDTTASTPWQEPTNNKRTYSIDCLRDSSITGGIIGFGNDLKKDWLSSDNEITPQKEREVGLEVKEQVEEEYTYSNNDAYINRIKAIMNRMLPLVADTTRYTYEWYVLESDVINAFTAGGQIFITTGIIDFANNDDELACIIGHEIYHNELGHIKEKLSEQEFFEDWLGDDGGQIAMMASSVLTMSFNQENEAYCDLYGLDLAIDAGYNGCAIANFWDRMQNEEEEADFFGKLMRTHPYSSERKQCIHNHVANNYDKGC